MILYYWREDFCKMIRQHIFIKRMEPSFLYEKWRLHFFKKIVSYDNRKYVILSNTRNAVNYHVRFLHILLIVQRSQPTVVCRDSCSLIIFLYLITLFLREMEPPFSIKWIVWTWTFYWLFKIWKLLAGSRLLFNSVGELSLAYSWSFYFIAFIC